MRWFSFPDFTAVVVCAGLISACDDSAAPPTPGSSAGGSDSAPEPEPTVSEGPMGKGGTGGSPNPPSSTGGNGGIAAGGRPSNGGDGGDPAGGAAGNGAGGNTEPVKPQPVCPAGPFETNPIPAQPVVQELCQDYAFSFAEGPVWLAQAGVLYFSDFQAGSRATNFNGSIVSYTPGGSCQTHITEAGTNGLALGANGVLLGASHLTQTIASFDPVTKVRAEVVLDYMGKKLSSPNDLTVSSQGHIYFTDPAYQVGDRPEVLPQGVYWRDPAGTLTLVEATARPNGITLSLDESRLFVAVPNAIRAFKVDASGKPSEPMPFIASGSDGMVLDCAGNLYLTTGNGVAVYDDAGQLKGRINVGASTTNVAFGGPDRKTLFITVRDGLRSVQLNVPGFPY